MALSNISLEQTARVLFEGAAAQFNCYADTSSSDGQYMNLSQAFFPYRFVPWRHVHKVSSARRKYALRLGIVVETEV